MSNEPNAKHPSIRKLLEITPFITALATLVAPLVSQKATIVGSAALVLLVSILWIWAFARKAQEALQSTKPIPAPQFLWRLIFHRLPAISGREYLPSICTNILAVADDSSLEIASKLSKRSQDRALRLQLFNCQNHSRKDLETALEKADAVFLFWTMDIRQMDWPHDTVNLWAYENSHKPVLVINRIPHKPYELTFNTIPEIDFQATGLWRLFARATERGDQWKSQAYEYRRLVIRSYCFFFVVILFIALWTVWEQRARQQLGRLLEESRRGEQNLRVEAKRRKERQALVEQHRLTVLRDSLRKTRQQLIKSRSSLGNLNLMENLQKYGDYAMHEFRLHHGLASEGSSALVFFREIHFERIHRSCFCEVAASDEKEDRFCFPLANSRQRKIESVIGCADQINGYALWKDLAEKGSPAAWDKAGEVIGTWDGEKIDIPGSRPCEFRVLDSRRNDDEIDNNIEDRPRDGLLCYKIPQAADEAGSGVCLDTKLGTETLGKPEARSFLQKVGSVMLLLPTESFSLEGLEKRCRSAL